jgi:hypothetical protein
MGDTEEQIQEENEVAEKRESILMKLDEAIMKLRRFLLTEVLPAIGATTAQIESAREQMNHDSTLYVPVIREFIMNYKQQIKTRDIDFFRALFPPEFAQSEISIEHQDKGALFAKVFKSILKDLDEQ